MDFRTFRLAPQGARQEAAPDRPRLDAEELRVLGCLVEKERATPDYYPMTLNGLIAGCNQKSSRHPVVSFSETTVSEAVSRLQDKHLTHRITSSESRVPRYRHVFPEAYALTNQQTAALCVLMLRGPQTSGEIRQRTGRIYEFESLADVEDTLESLLVKKPRELVGRLPRRPGEKESRWVHLLGDEPEEALAEAHQETAAAPAPRESRSDKIEAELAELRREVAELRADLARLRADLE